MVYSISISWRHPMLNFSLEEKETLCDYKTVSQINEKNLTTKREHWDLEYIIWYLRVKMPREMVSSVQLLSRVPLFATAWTAAHQASLSITTSWSPPKLMSIELVMLFNHLILCGPLLLPPSIFPTIRVFSNESVLHIRWPKYWSFSFCISPFNEPSNMGG